MTDPNPTPFDRIDPETRPKLEAYRDGTVSFGRLDSWCRWSQKPEFDRCHLNWRMVGFAEDAEAERRAEENTHWFMLKTGRGDEYMIWSDTSSNFIRPERIYP